MDEEPQTATVSRRASLLRLVPRICRPKSFTFSKLMPRFLAFNSQKASVLKIRAQSSLQTSSSSMVLWPVGLCSPGNKGVGSGRIDKLDVFRELEILD
jgi:hypothetical protein